MVNIVRRLPAEHVLGTLGKHTDESHVGNIVTDIIAVDERRVTQYGRLLSEIFLYLGALAHHLVLETCLINQRSKSVRVRLSQELYTTRIVELLQFLQYLRSMKFQLLHTHSRKRESDLEILAVLFNHLLKGIQGWHIRALSNLVDATVVLVVIIIVMVGTDIKEAVAFQMGNLMYLEI